MGPRTEHPDLGRQEAIVTHSESQSGLPATDDGLEILTLNALYHEATRVVGVVVWWVWWVWVWWWVWMVVGAGGG